MQGYVNFHEILFLQEEIEKIKKENETMKKEREQFQLEEKMKVTGLLGYCSTVKSAILNICIICDTVI